MKNKVTKLTFSMIFYIFIFYGTYHIIKNLEYEVITKNLFINPNTYLMIVLLFVIHEIINIYQNLKLYSFLQNNFNHLHFIIVYYASSLSKYVMFFKLGTPIRIGLLKSFLGIKVRNSISVKIIFVSTSITSTFLSGLFGLHLSASVNEQIPKINLILVPLILLLLIIFSIGIFKIVSSARLNKIWLIQRMISFIEDLNSRIRKFSFKVIFFVSVGMIFRSILMSLISFFIINEISTSYIDFFSILAIISISNIAAIFSLLPAGLGTKDISLIYLLTLIGVEKELAIILLAYDRFIWNLVPILIGAFAFLFLKQKTIENE